MLKIMLGWRLSFNACHYAGTKRHSSTSPSADRFFYNAFGSPLMLHFFHYNAQYCLSYTCTEAFVMFIVNNKVSELMFFIDQKIMV